MKPKLTIRAIPVASEDARRSFGHAIGLLAEALANQAIAEAREQVASELGATPDGIDRERGRLTEEADSILAAPGLLRRSS